MMKKFFQDFKLFCMRGNILDLAVGVMIGGAFGSIVNSLVNDLLMPVIGLITGGVDFSGLFLALDFQSYPTREAAKTAGIGTLNYGAFLQAVINFLIMAFCVFLMIRLMSKLLPKKEEIPLNPRKCPFCIQAIDEKATRCPHCTSELINGKACS